MIMASKFMQLNLALHIGRIHLALQCAVAAAVEASMPMTHSGSKTLERSFMLPLEGKKERHEESASVI